jgi:phenylpropionate dioxygenase-like ring-hydroxylating dioxygenase large terminal subunit
MTRHDPALSPTDALRANVALPFGQAVAMPKSVYTSPGFATLEQTHIFARDWLCAGRADTLPNPGDYRAFDNPGGPIVLVRGNDGVLRCFANYCRHRGSILLEGTGNVGGRIICPYHAWSYLNDGRLYGCPLFWRGGEQQLVIVATHGRTAVPQLGWQGV